MRPSLSSRWRAKGLEGFPSRAKGLPANGGRAKGLEGFPSRVAWEGPHQLSRGPQALGGLNFISDLKSQNAPKP
uniref:Uncharacterized protein orf73 n=1 Tax=Monomastix sp. (strain OKE-1) TaxID=141716 RepID=C0JWQ2_MONSK|nr:hypothetical protein MoOKC_p068 [Monomastix sp. OKE-1]ACK36923.1 unknown [Monomastix sp. OKE-1]